MAEYGSPTWKVSFWLNNDQGVYEMFRDTLHNGGSVADEFYDVFVVPIPEGLGKDVFIDLLSDVDWDEVESDLKGDDWELYERA
jgi:hypothetical protein